MESAFSSFTSAFKSESFQYWAALVGSYILIALCAVHILSHYFLQMWVYITIMCRKQSTAGMRALAFLWVLVYTVFVALLSYVSLEFVMNTKIISKNTFHFEGILGQELSKWVFYGMYSVSMIPAFYAIIVAFFSWIAIAIGERIRRKAAKAIEDFKANKKNTGERIVEVPMPLVQIIMPIYREPIENLKAAVESLCKSKYTVGRLNVMMSFDDYEISETFAQLVDYLQGRPSTSNAVRFAENYPEMINVDFKGIHFTIARFEHSGKLGTQRKTFEYLQKKYPVGNERPRLFFIDSDVVLYPETVRELSMYLEKNEDREAVTGFVFCQNAWSFNLWQYMQDAEYAEAQLLYRSAETSLGSVTVLPGVCTMIRFEALESVAGDYFYSEAAKNAFDFCHKDLGEDRYLTHLLMMKSPEKKGRLGFWMLGKCKTEAVESFWKLVNQRRRWLLATITNEALMLSTPRLWFNMFFLMLFRFFMSLKFGGLLFYVYLLDVCLSYYENDILLKVLFLALAIVPQWFVVSLLAISERRFKIILLFPIFFLFGPLFTFFFTINSILTLRNRSWGGPRAKKPTANASE